MDKGGAMDVGKMAGSSARPPPSDFGRQIRMRTPTTHSNDQNTKRSYSTSGAPSDVVDPATDTVPGTIAVHLIDLLHNPLIVSVVHPPQACDRLAA